MGATDISLPILNLSARRAMVKATPKPFYPWERDPVPFIQEPGWVLGLAITRVRMASIKNISHKALKCFHKSILHSRS